MGGLSQCLSYEGSNNPYVAVIFITKMEAYGLSLSLWTHETCTETQAPQDMFAAS